MTSVGAEDEEYESDPEQAKLSLTMRRREASDDEDDDQDEEVEALPPGPRTATRAIDSSRVSDCDSDGQGAAADYDDEDSDYYDEEEEDEEIVDDEYYEVSGGRQADGKGLAVGTEVNNNINNNEGQVEEDASSRGDEKLGGAPTEGGGEYYNVEEDGEQFEDNASGGKVQEEKENEPFAVPTAGAFYMHDDRLRDSAGGGSGRHGRTFGGRRLWESKDDRKWGHDKFEEMTMQERHYEEGRRASRGRNRGRGRSRGEDRGFSRGSRPKPLNNNNQNNVPKAVRGRGPRRYQPTFKNNSEAPMQNRQPGKSAEKNSHASSGRAPVSQSSIESAPVPARNNVIASSLSSASPPFYPSGSSNKEINMTQKRDQAGPINRNLRPPVMRESFAMQQSNTMGGKNGNDSTGMEKLHINDSISPLAGKPLTNTSLPISGPPFINSTQPPYSRVQGRGSTPLGQVAYQATVPPHNQVNRVSSATQNHGYQHSSAQNRLQPSMQASNQQLGKRSGVGSQASSPPKAALSIHSLDSAESESTLESSISKTALVGKGKGSIQGSGRGSFPYAGAQVLGAAGNIGGGHGDQNFPFLPVMQFGGQHPGGIGVPAVGMAFPGYVAQPNGLGNSEMTWLPVLAGAAGALGATYCSPYLAVDGAYHARPSGQTSSFTAVSKENNINKLGSELKPSQRPESANDELGQRQNKPRRYTEMKFDQ